MKLSAENFLGLPDFVWEPGSVCLLTGPNGSGKTSLLNAFAFLCGVFLYGVPRAVQFLGGARGFKRRGTPPDVPVRVSLQVDEVTWTLEVFANAGAVSEYPGERLTVNGQVVLRRVAGSNEWSLGDQRVTDTLDDEPRSCLRSAWDRDRDSRWGPLIEALRGMRIYNQKWSVPRLWDAALPFNEQVFLDSKGSNLFSVLHNWRANPRRYRDQFEWVRQHARNAFGDIFDDLEILPLGDAVSVDLLGSVQFRG